MTWVSVILTTKDWTRYGDFLDAMASIEAQSYDDIELVCPIDHSEEMVTATRALADGGAVTYVDTDGMAAARNRGAAAASGDVYAFIDDDCVAAESWVAELVAAYRDGALAAGGPAVPAWPGDGRPAWLPPAFDWLVGCGPYHDAETTVRNTYGCNLSFRADVFDALEGFDETLGKGTPLDQGEEAAFCNRLQERFGAEVQYRPAARVRHRVYPEQLRPTALLARAYLQGVAKAAVGVDDEERGFAREVLAMLPTRHGPAVAAYTAATAAGYLVHRRRSS